MADRNGGSSSNTLKESAETTPEQTLVESCVAIVEERRKGQITMSKATLLLLDHLPDEDQSDALERYLDELAEIEREHALAHFRGNIDREPADQPRNQDNEESDDESSHEADTCALAENVRSGSKRSADNAFGPSTSESTKKSNESLYAWRRFTLSKDHLNPTIALTLKLKKNYLQDLKGAKNDIVSNPYCPVFPDGLWTDILAGHFIELDKVISGYYSLESDCHQTQSIGDVDITVNSGAGANKPSKTVRTHGEWTIAFVAMRRATLFAYPHRAEEFDDYEQFMVGQFGAFSESQHGRVLNLNRAIRVRVSRSNHFLLTDFNKFADLTLHHLIGNSGATVVPAAKKAKQKATIDGNAPICRRWNGGKCNSEGCNYKHLCLTCGGKHQAKNCGIKPSEGSK